MEWILNFFNRTVDIGSWLISCIAIYVVILPAVLMPLIMGQQWVISFRANYSNQLTCIPFAVTNKALPVKGLAKDPINKLIFLQF